MHGLIIVKNHTKKHARAKLYNFTKHGVPKRMSVIMRLVWQIVNMHKITSIQHEYKGTITHFIS
jgi:hypothetical protein